jgi:hypothetical protein
MRAKRFHVLHFPVGAPEWLRFEGGTCTPIETPGETSGLPVVVVIPDRYFFYHLPPGLTVRGERRQKAAVALRLGQVFPAPGPEQEWGVLPSGPAGMPGFYTHPELAGFWEQHRDVLAQASLVTTTFALAWCWSQAKALEEWTLPGSNGEAPLALFHQGELHVLHDAASLARDLAAAGQDPPPFVDWREVLAHSGDPGLAWSRLRIPLRGFASVRINLRPFVYAAVSLTLAALLLYTIPARSLFTYAQAAKAWEQARHDLYAKGLGAEPGRDPFGQLVAKLERLKGRQGGSLDLLEFLAGLSANAPTTLEVETVNITPAAGTVSGKVGTYEALEAYLKSLPKDGPFAYTLEQATNMPGGVSFSLKVTPSQPGGRQ